jgi:hypothetical protein
VAEAGKVQQSKLLNVKAISGTDFSLVLGGPLYQLYLRTRLTTPSLSLVLRRIVVLSLACWGPLLLLALFEGHLFGRVSIPFLVDLGVHIRFLVALPLLIAAEVFVHRRIPVILRQFLERGIVQDRSRFAELVASATRLRNSLFVEVMLLLFAFGVHWSHSEFLTWGVSTWYAVKMSGETHFTAAGFWYIFVALPILRFIMFRWYFRLFVWYWFLWHVRRLPLHLNLFHPDRAGGLGFLADSVFAFSPVLLAQTIVTAAIVGNRIWHAGASLPSFKMEIAGIVAFFMLLVLTPLSFFIVWLERAGRQAKRAYGILASQYVEDFYRKQIQHRGTDGEPLLGTTDIQSLADLANAYSNVSAIRLVPFGNDTVMRLAIIIVAPFLPLTLTMIPFERIVDQVVKLVL